MKMRCHTGNTETKKLFFPKPGGYPDHQEDDGSDGNEDSQENKEQNNNNCCDSNNNHPAVPGSQIQTAAALPELSGAAAGIYTVYAGRISAFRISGIFIAGRIRAGLRAGVQNCPGNQAVSG